MMKNNFWFKISGGMLPLLVPTLIVTWLGLAQKPLLAHGVHDPEKVEVYVTPYYDSKGPKIEAGEYSEGLRSNDETAFAATIAKMRQDWNQLPFTTMYMAAIRLYDLGYRDEAVYWFYSAQYRGRLFTGVVDRAKAQAGGLGNPAFELVQAHSAFFQLSGQYINGYAFRDTGALAGLLKKIQKENAKAVPDFKAAHPKVEFLDERQWAVANQQVNSGMSGLIEMLQKERESIKKERQANGTEATFSKLTSKPLPVQ